MDKNFFIALLITTLMIIIYASPQYQRRFGKEAPIVEREKQSPHSQSTSPQEEKKTAPIVIPEENAPPQKELPAVLKENAQDYIQVNPPDTITTITIKNKDIKVTISSMGGVITQSVLNDFTGRTKEEKVHLVSEGESWCDTSVLEGKQYISFTNVNFTIKEMAENHVVLTAELTGNRFVTKEFSLKPESYQLHAITNLSGDWHDPILNLAIHGALAETEAPYKQLKIWPFSMFMGDQTRTFNKLVYLGQGDRTRSTNNGNGKPKRVYSKEGSQKIEAKKSGKGSDTFVGDLDWFAVKNKYFITAVIPEERERWSVFAQHTTNEENLSFDFTLSKRLTDGNTGVDIFMGPMQYTILKAQERNLTEAMELSYRFVRPLTIAFLWLFNKIHRLISNWGIVILIFSLIIKLVLYPLSKTSYTSMKKMSKVQPQINEMREKFKNNPKMLQKATMELYKKEGVNPFSGCLPILLQLPVFFALYPVVDKAFELRQAMFIPYWIVDLSRPDPYYILPIAMGISMYFQSKSTMTDPNQKPMLYIMPVMMVILFANFSAGLTLYWFLFNVTSSLQQKFQKA
jgi:YidC/Oxa1 family membrane protein insertase